MGRFKRSTAFEGELWHCKQQMGMCRGKSTINFGYGTYQWKVISALDQLDKNIVLGFFNYSGNSGHDEMDIEFSRWGYPNANMLNYSIWPKTGDNIPYVTYNVGLTLSRTWTTHRFKKNKHIG